MNGNRSQHRRTLPIILSGDVIHIITSHFATRLPFVTLTYGSRLEATSLSYFSASWSMT